MACKTLAAFGAVLLFVGTQVLAGEEEEVAGKQQAMPWNYLNQQLWMSLFPQCKGLNLRQSPIDIVTSKVKFNPDLKLDFLDYNQEVEFEFRNTHHSVSLTPLVLGQSKPGVRINWLPDADEFELQEIHFHWGDGLNKGSEHEINDQRAAAEMHMVHYKKGLTKDQIGQVNNSVVVVGVMIESDKIEHNKLEGLVSKTSHVNGTDVQYIDTNPENLINLLPESRQSFYTYQGSLTTPPCYEVVTWVILSEPVYMAHERLEELSNIEASHGILGRIKIAANFRDIQPLLDRPVYASFNVSQAISTTANLSDKPQKIGALSRNGKLMVRIKKYWKKLGNLKASAKRAIRGAKEARKGIMARLSSRSQPKAEPSSE